MKKLLLSLSLLGLSSCVTPVTPKDFRACKHLCYNESGVKEICRETLDKLGCHCNNEVIFWKYESIENQYDVTQPYE